MAKIIKDYERETTPEAVYVKGIESLKFHLPDTKPWADDLVLSPASIGTSPIA